MNITIVQLEHVLDRLIRDGTFEISREVNIASLMYDFPGNPPPVPAAFMVEVLDQLLKRLKAEQRHQRPPVIERPSRPAG